MERKQEWLYEHKINQISEQSITRDKEGHYLIMKESMHKEDRAMKNVYVPHNRGAKYAKQKLIELKGEIHKPTIIIGDSTLSSTSLQTNLIGNQQGYMYSSARAAMTAVSPEASLLVLQMAAFSLCPHMAFLLCVHTSLVCFPHIKILILFDQGPLLMTFISLNYLIKTLFPNIVTFIRKDWNIYILGEGTESIL